MNRIHKVTCALAGWPADQLPTQAQVDNYMRQVMDRLEHVLKPTTRLVAWSEGQPPEILADGWKTGSWGLPKEDFDFVVTIEFGKVDCAFNGTCGFHGRGPAMRGHSIHSSWTLDESKMEAERWAEMVKLVAHEKLHELGCAVGEMYDLHAQDMTGVEPILHCDARNPEDPFWLRHQEWLKDPMVRNDGDTLCALNVAICNGNWSQLHFPLPPKILSLRLLGLPPEEGYTARLWRQNSITGADGYPVDHQELISETLLIGELWDVDPGLSINLLQPGESQSVLLTLDMFLLKIHGPGVSYATWLTVWDWMLDDEGMPLDIAELVIDFKQFTPQEPPTPTSEIVLEALLPRGLVRATGCTPGVTYELLAKDLAPVESVWRVVSQAVAETPILRIMDESNKPDPGSRIYRLRSKPNRACAGETI